MAAPVSNVPTPWNAQRSRQDGVTALAGGGQTGATPLTADINRITTVATTADSVQLPQATGRPYELVIINAGANSMNLYPFLGDKIDAVAVNGALAVAANARLTMVSITAGQWHSLPLVAS